MKIACSLFRFFTTAWFLFNGFAALAGDLTGPHAVAWSKTYNGPNNADDNPSVMAVDASGNVIVAGRTYPPGNGELVVLKYAASTGGLLWERRFGGPVGGVEQYEAIHPTAMAVDANGNVFVTGAALRVGAGWPMLFIVKFSGASGALLWEKFQGNGAIRGDSGLAIAVDASGNAIVSGYSSATSPNLLIGDYFTIFTAKYAGGNGGLLWKRTYGGAGVGDNVPRAVAVDAGGNAIVTGYVDARYSGGYSLPDIYTVKYAAGTGAVLWQRRYGGAAGSADIANALALDASGNAIITGAVSTDDFFSTHPYTAKYAAATGAVLWQNIETLKGEARSVVVDAAGNPCIAGWASANGLADPYIAKLGAGTGIPIWKKSFSYSTSPISYGGSSLMAAGHTGNVVMAGASLTAFASTDGAVLWSKTLTPSIVGIKLDPLDNICVVANSYSTTSKHNFFTQRVTPATRIIRVYGYTAFGDVPLNTTKTANLYIKNEGYLPLKVSGILYPPGFSGDFYGTIPSAGYVTVPVSFKPTAAQAYGGELLVASDNTSGAENRAISGKGIPATRILELSGNMAFGSVPLGSTKTATLNLKNTGNAPLTVSSITYPVGFSGAFTGTLAAAASRNVTVTFTPTAVLAYSGTVQVNSDKTSGVHLAAASGTGAPTRVLGLSGSLAFGSVPVGSTKTAILTLSNSGRSPLTVTGITYPAGFSGNFAGTIAAGGSRDVIVSFKPTAYQSYAGNLTVNSDKTSGTNTKAVAGTGTATRIIGLSGNLIFGTIAVGTVKTAVLSISNTGNSPLNITGIAYPAGFRGVFSGVIAAGSSRNVTVTFEPLTVRAYGGSVNVSSDKTAGTYTLAISGTAQ